MERAGSSRRRGAHGLLPRRCEPGDGPPRLEGASRPGLGRGDRKAPGRTRGQGPMGEADGVLPRRDVPGHRGGKGTRRFGISPPGRSGRSRYGPWGIGPRRSARTGLCSSSTGRRAGIPSRTRTSGSPATTLPLCRPGPWTCAGAGGRPDADRQGGRSLVSLATMRYAEFGEADSKHRRIVVVRGLPDRRGTGAVRGDRIDRRPGSPRTAGGSPS
jgi:hypothetical protein